MAKSCYYEIFQRWTNVQQIKKGKLKYKKQIRILWNSIKDLQINAKLVSKAPSKKEIIRGIGLESIQYSRRQESKQKANAQVQNTDELSTKTCGNQEKKYPREQINVLCFNLKDTLK